MPGLNFVQFQAVTRIRLRAVQYFAHNRVKMLHPGAKYGLIPNGTKGRNQLKTIDENKFFREITLRICSSLDISQALLNTYQYLKLIMPVKSIGLYYFDPKTKGIHALTRISSDAGMTQIPTTNPLFKLNDVVIEEWKTKMVDPSIPDTEIISSEEIQQILERSPGVLRFIPEMIQQKNLRLRLHIQENRIGVVILSFDREDTIHEHYFQLVEAVKEPFAIAMINARRYQETVRLKNILTEENIDMRRELEQISGNQVIGADFGLKHVIQLIRQVAPMNSPVLLLGETGTGKEVIANAIHLASPRRQGPIIRVQCGAIPETLLDSELFGHEKGAFTGAVSAKRGRFERANHGTIFLDEIGELTLEAQVKLLRVLQEHEIDRLGGTQTTPVDVRVIAATHRNLPDMVLQGKFREDLWFRLNVFPIRIPPLRERKEDISSLTQHFLHRKAREMSLQAPPKISSTTLKNLQEYDWPGNVRELQNIIERALILNRGSASLEIPPLRKISPSGSPIQTESPNVYTGKTLDEAITDHILKTLEATHGIIKGNNGAAKRLGINPSTLRAKMAKLGIPFGRNAAN